MVEGLELSIQNMYKGETSIFYIQPEYGFGRVGSQMYGIGPDQQLVYEITLIDFTKGLESWQLDDDGKIDLIEKRKQQGNALYVNDNFKFAVRRYERGAHLLPYVDHLSPEQKKRCDELKVACLSNWLQCDLKMGNKDAILPRCNTILSMDPNHYKALLRRAYEFAETGKLDEAIQDAQKAAEVLPSSSVATKLVKALEARRRKKSIKPVAGDKRKEQTAQSGKPAGQRNVEEKTEERSDSKTEIAADGSVTSHNSNNNNNDNSRTSTSNDGAASAAEGHGESEQSRASDLVIKRGRWGSRKPAKGAMPSLNWDSLSAILDRP
eukprot:g306.t1